MRLQQLNFHSKLGLSGLLITIILGAMSAATLIGLLYSNEKHGFNLPDISQVQAHYSESLLVSSMKTSMYPYVTIDEDIDVVKGWIDQGAVNNDYFKNEVMPIIESDCQSCHSRRSTMTGAIPSMPLSHYQDIVQYTEKGYSWTYMAKAAHIHLFGIALLLGFATLILSFSSYRSWVKTGLISTAWLALWMDISAWWLAKFYDSFIYVIVVAGTIEVASLVSICLLCLVNLWCTLPKFLADDETRH